MKLNMVSWLFLSLIFLGPFFWDFSPFLSTKDSDKSISADKELRRLFSKMVYIEGDSFLMGQTVSLGIKTTAADSTLFTGYMPKRTAVDPYYISATEITNAEWREFYQAKRIELGEISAKNMFFPDTSLWVKEFPYSYNAPMAKHYFSNPSFKDFPVVGISWDQANAYCLWKSKKLETMLKKAGVNKSTIDVRLPNEAEWEYAAIKKEQDNKQKGGSAYIQPENKLLERINGMANIGQIIDINNVVIKAYQDDGCLYTCKVAFYSPNDNGIYDMIGNVSEWTSDKGYIEIFSFKNHSYEILTKLSEVDSEIERLKKDTGIEDIELKKLLLESLEHDREILSTDDIKICKGGSWANGMIYAQPGSRQGVRKNYASTKIGFRIVIQNVDKKALKYFPKKTWKP